MALFLMCHTHRFGQELVMSVCELQADADSQHPDKHRKTRLSRSRVFLAHSLGIIENAPEYRSIEGVFN